MLPLVPTSGSAAIDSDPVVETLAGMSRNAERLREVHPTGLFVDSSGRRFHLRPTRDGVTLVCLEPEFPQLGLAVDVRRVGDLQWLDAQARLLTKNPLRLTPEKKVQSLLVAGALAAARVLPSVLAPEGMTLEFLVDELVVQAGPGAAGSRRGDMIAVATRGDRVVPAFIELKADRQATTLLEQLRAMETTFFGAPASTARRAALASFASLVLGRAIPPFIEAGADHAVGVIVWPAAAAGPRRRTPSQVDDCPDLVLRVVGYGDDGHVLEHEVP